MNTIITAEGWHIIEQDSHVGKWITESGRLDHDRHLHDFIENLLTEKAKEHKNLVAIDCGALYGDTTIGMCRGVGSGGCVVAIEASPMSFSCLKENAKKFQSPVICMNLALGDVHGGDAVHIMIDNVGASQVSSKTEKPEDLPANRIENIVKTASIDGISNDAALERLDFIKIDCEGFEFKILKGAKHTLKKFRPILLIEMNSWALSQQDSSYKDIYDFLLELNYSWRIVQDLKGGDPQYDILCWSNAIEQVKSII